MTTCGGGQPRRTAGARSGPLATTALRRSRIAGAIRSSSCAQTDAEHETVSTPPRSAVGSASPRSRRRPPRATPAGPRRATSAGASSSRIRSSASASGRGLRRQRHQTHGLLEHAAVGTPRAARRPSSPAPGTCSRSVVVITAWPPSRAAARPARWRRSPSSSLITSSSSITGGAPRGARRSPRARPAAAPAAPSRCWPCEPYARSSRPPSSSRELVAVRARDR